jgi:hypothetical protein
MDGRGRPEGEGDDRVTTRAEREARDRQVVELRRQKLKLEAIGAQMGLTRERVRQIVAAHDRAFGTQTLSAAQRSADAAARRQARAKAYKDDRAQRLYGCDHATLIALSPDLGDRGSPARRYREHRRKALARGIGFEFTLPQWLKVWTESGHWAERGRGEGYCMARRGDVGPYAEGNVYITTIGGNFSDGWVNRKRRAAELLGNKSGN